MSQTSDDPLPDADDDPVAERLPLIDLESAGTLPPSRRKRGAQVGLAVLALLVAATVVWNSLGSGKRPVTSSVPQMPISALVVSNLTNATITLNGKKLAGHPPMVVVADLESDTITVSAPLFRSQTCRFQGLSIKTDTANCLFTVDSDTTPSAPEYVLGAFLTPDDLLPALQNQITAPITQQLAQALQTAVQPGDYLATAFPNQNGAITSQRASAPLQASATFIEGLPFASTLRFPPQLYAPPCGQLLCSAGFGSSDSLPVGQVWEMGLNVMLRWQFTNSAGNSVADVGYQPDASTGFSPVLPAIEYDYTGSGWHLAPGTNLDAVLQSALCDDGVALLYQHALSLQSFFDYAAQPIHQSAAGCLIAAQFDGAKSTFLWRFGVLLAADAGAHALFPGLPVAPSSELAAAMS